MGYVPLSYEVQTLEPFRSRPFMHNGYDAVDSKNQPLVSQADYLKNIFFTFCSGFDITFFIL